MKKEDLRWAKNEWIGEKIVGLCNWWKEEYYEEEAYSTGEALFYIFKCIIIFIVLPLTLIYFIIVVFLIPLYYGIITHPTESILVIGVFCVIAILGIICNETGFYSKSIHDARLKKERRSKK